MDHISYSRLNTFRRCPRMFEYRYELRIEREGPPFPPMLGGYALHAGIAEWWRTRKLDGALAELRAAWRERMPEEEALLPTGGRYDYLTLPHLETVMRRYADSDHLKGFKLSEAMPVEWSGVRSLEVKEGAGVSEAAITAMIDPALPPVAFRIDALMEDEAGRFHILDRKCKVSWLNDHSIQQSIGQGHQLRLYQIVVEKLLGVRVHSCWIEGIYMGTEPKSGWNKVQSKPLGLFGPYVYVEDDLQETLDWAAATLADIEHAQHAVFGFPQNDAGGCPNCEFKDLCALPRSAREAAIESDFQVREDRSGDETEPTDS